jgi:hypothetical protein
VCSVGAPGHSWDGGNIEWIQSKEKAVRNQRNHQNSAFTQLGTAEWMISGHHSIEMQHYITLPILHFGRIRALRTVNG